MRAWTIKEGWKAPQAAGTIHGDFERGFIKAETCLLETSNYLSLHLLPLTSYLLLPTSYLSPRTSYLLPFASHPVPLTSYLLLLTLTRTRTRYNYEDWMTAEMDVEAVKKVPLLRL